MAITYTVADYGSEDKTVEVTYTNDAGLIHKRQINIPYLENGLIDEEYLQEIFEGQLRGVENKLKVGVIQFTDPSDAVGVGTT